jgi:hypothetical protein
MRRAPGLVKRPRVGLSLVSHPAACSTGITCGTTFGSTSLSRA